MASPAISILKRATSRDVRTEPFPYLHIENALPPEYYRRLAASFPGRSLMLDGQTREQNTAYVFSGVPTLTDPKSQPPEWSAFMRYHLSIDFFRDIIKLFGAQFRAIYPDFEMRVGKKFADMTVGPRFEGAPWDIQLDCQFCVNSPVVTPSTVRGPHIDSNRKLFNALLYLRLDEDDSTGGDFEIYKLKHKPEKEEYGARGDLYGVEDNVVKTAACIPYRANSLVLFLNSLNSFHGVSPRGVTQVPRQYINFLVECNFPLFPFHAKHVRY